MPWRNRYVATRHPGPEKVARPAGEPIMAIVSLKSQQVTFYDSVGWIMRAPVSTGVKGRETPAGVFAVIEKDKDHHSTLYDDAWMPNMQRITWNGIALHGGPLPGYAASHGCIRMPYGFAEDMFDKTRIGMRVIISPNDATPVDFSHPALFVPDAEVIAGAPARAEALAREAADVAKAADAAKKAAAASAREATSLAAVVRKLERQKTRADGKLAAADKAIAAAEKARARAEDLRQKAAAKAADAGSSARRRQVRRDGEARRGRARTGQRDVTTKRRRPPLRGARGNVARRPVRKLERQKARADAKLAAAEKAVAAADQAKARAEELKQKAVTDAADLATQLATAKARREDKAR